MPRTCFASVRAFLGDACGIRDSTPTPQFMSMLVFAQARCAFLDSPFAVVAATSQRTSVTTQVHLTQELEDVNNETETRAAVVGIGEGDSGEPGARAVDDQVDDTMPQIVTKKGWGLFTDERDMFVDYMVDEEEEEEGVAELQDGFVYRDWVDEEGRGGKEARLRTA